MPQVNSGLQMSAAEKFRQYMYERTFGLKHKDNAEYSEHYMFQLLDDVALEEQQEYTAMLTHQFIPVEMLIRYFLDFPARFRKFFVNCTPEEFLLNTQRVCSNLESLNYSCTNYSDPIRVQDAAKANANSLKQLINEIGFQIDARQLPTPIKDQILTVLISCLLKSKVNGQKHRSYQECKVQLFLGMLTDVNIQDEAGDTLLHVALRSVAYNTDLITTLDLKGAKVTLHNAVDETALTLALGHHPEYIKHVAKQVVNLPPAEIANTLKAAIWHADAEWIKVLTAKLSEQATWSKLQTAIEIFPRSRAITRNAVQGFIVFAQVTKLEVADLLDKLAADNKLELVFAIVKGLLQSKSYWSGIEATEGKHIFYYLAHNQDMSTKLLNSDALQQAYFINNISLNPLAQFFIKKDKSRCPLTIAASSANVPFVHFVIRYAQYLDSYNDPLILQLQNALLTLRKNNVNIGPILDLLTIQAAKHWVPSRWFSIQYRLLQTAVRPIETPDSNKVPETNWGGFFWSFCTKAEDEAGIINQQLTQPLLTTDPAVVTAADNNSMTGRLIY